MDIQGLGADIFKLSSFAVLAKVALVLLVLANFKNFPLVYHLRILNGIRFVLRSQRPKVKLSPEHLFLPLITSSRATLMETDVFGHKSNSTYFSDLDIARTHFVTTVFGEAIEKCRGSTTMNGLSGKPRSAFTMPLGEVSCTFKKELKPYEPYDMWTRILSWDDKWFYLVTHFVPQRACITPKRHVLYPQQDIADTLEDFVAKPESGNSKVAATALSKVVFKNGRKTIAPAIMLELAGLLPGDSMDPAIKAWASPSESKSVPDLSCTQKRLVQPLHESIEFERQRGMRSVRNEQDLGLEFRGKIALGRHFDGHGVEGVLATLAQLGKLSRYQLL